MRTAIIAIMAAAASPALAHKVGCDGKPVPNSIVGACCSAADAHQLTPADWSRDASGAYHVRVGEVDVATDTSGHALQALPSPDGCAWGFWLRYDPQSGHWTPDGTGEVHFYCLFLPFAI